MHIRVGGRCPSAVCIPVLAFPGVVSRRMTSVDELENILASSTGGDCTDVSFLPLKDLFIIVVVILYVCVIHAHEYKGVYARAHI